MNATSKLKKTRNKENNKCKLGCGILTKAHVFFAPYTTSFKRPLHLGAP